MASEYNEAAEQAWPSFTDILSSTVVVLCFCLLVLVIVLSVTRITSSTARESDQSSPSKVNVESEVLGEYRAEFQKLVIIANPSLMKEMKIQSDQPTTPIVEKQSYTPIDAPIVANNQEIKELGDSKKQVLGDIPKTVDTNTLEVLKELIIVQQDVIAQQRKVIEQQDETIVDSVREYQSLLSLVTKEKEIEDVRQKVFKKPEQASFIEIDSDGERLNGKATELKGNGNYILNSNSNVLSFATYTPTSISQFEYNF